MPIMGQVLADAVEAKLAQLESHITKIIRARDQLRSMVQHRALLNWEDPPAQMSTMRSIIVTELDSAKADLLA